MLQISLALYPLVKDHLKLSLPVQSVAVIEFNGIGSILHKRKGITHHDI